MKVLILLADGFEQCEALVFQDYMRRAGVETSLVSISHSLIVTSSSHVKVEANYLLDGFDYSKYDLVYLPGGKVGVDNLDKSDKVKEVINYFVKENKYIAAICAAPSILGKMGLLDHKNFTCFPGFEYGKGIKFKGGAIQDGHLFTGRSMYFTYELAELIVKTLLGENVVHQVDFGTKGIE